MKPAKNHRVLLPLLPGVCYLAEFTAWKLLPQSHALNGVLGALWTAGQIGILFILINLYREKISGSSALKSFGVVVAALGAICYIVNYVLGYWFQLNTKLFLPIGALLTGIGMIITGLQLLRRDRWQSHYRFTPLVVGLYPFLIMFPLVIITGRPDLNAILLWGIPWLLLGIGMSTRSFWNYN